MYQSYSGYAFVAIIMVCMLVWFGIWVFELVWNHLFHYVLMSLFDYDLKKIDMKLSLAIIVSAVIINLLFFGF